MRRAILFLAFLAVGASGCHSSSRCDVGGTLTLYWQPPQGGFTTATGQLLGCDAAGVATVDVTVNGTSAGTFNCHGPTADGIQLTGFGDETVSIQLDAFDASNRHLYQEVTSASTALCADTLVDANLAAVQAAFQVSYALPGGNTCPPSSYLWYSIVDVTGNTQFALVDAQNSPTAVPCGSQLIFDQALFGQYRLDFIQVVTPTGNGFQPWGALYEYCSPLTFNHNTANDTLFVPTLSPATGLCQ